MVIVTRESQVVAKITAQALYTFYGSYPKQRCASVIEFALTRSRFRYLRPARNPRIFSNRPLGVIIVTCESVRGDETFAQGLYTFYGSYLGRRYETMLDFALARSGFIYRQLRQNLKKWRRHPPGVIIGDRESARGDETFAQGLYTFYGAYLR